MKTMKLSGDYRFMLLVVAVVLLTNGCGISEMPEQTSMVFEIFNRSLFNSLPGIY